MLAQALRRAWDRRPRLGDDPARHVGSVVRFAAGLLALQICAAALDLALPPDMGRAVRSSPVALDRNGAWLRALPVEDGRWRVRADLDRTDPSFLKRLIAVEDERFWLHYGVDPVSMVRALVGNAAAGEVTSGGSTITMQTVRLLEPRPRNLGSKLVEIVRAAQLEARLSKREILALYLTLAPYGGNLEGVRAASLSWFGHEPESLTTGEQALLIALPQSPESRRPDRRPQAARAARAEVLERMRRAGAIDSFVVAEAAGEPMPGARAAFPRLAWHAAGRLAAAAPLRQATVHTTLDAGLQSRLEDLARDTARAQGPDATVAILVVDIRTRGVLASVGSGGLDRAGGWVDMTRALRSPGSALKPFVYAMAFDQGIAAPDTVLQDAAVRFGDYQPENFDHAFHGQVSVREALMHSLNVPAVATLARIGPEAFHARLESAGVRLVRPREKDKAAGLALALGGAGITLQDLAVLYAALGDEGQAKPLAWTLDEAARRGRSRGSRLVDAEAAASVLDILRETPAPRGRTPGALTARGPRIAWKTGTSYGFRDALAAGVGAGKVVVVWTGRADGGARGGLTGRDAAAPLLFDAFDLLDGPSRAPSPIAPRGAPLALTQLAEQAEGPVMIFPPDGSTVQIEAAGEQGRGLVLAARGEDLTWYVDGRELPVDVLSGRVVWRPSAPGFYRLVVVDPLGRSVSSRVRVRTP
ncbi:MAG: penicillin-binding protein 1C [Caulobacteraceae bacterium]|nr:penicillin-binding protein 1C [Caulobacteraceae bacterium]